MHGYRPYGAYPAAAPPRYDYKPYALPLSQSSSPAVPLTSHSHSDSQGAAPIAAGISMRDLEAVLASHNKSQLEILNEILLAQDEKQNKRIHALKQEMKDEL